MRSMAKGVWVAGLVVAVGGLAGCKGQPETPVAAAPPVEAASPVAEATPNAPTPAPSVAAEAPVEAPPADDARQAEVTITIVHDTICPWCRIGHHRLKQALGELPGVRARIVYEPFLLDPDTPPEGQDMRERLAAKYGAERIEGMFARVTQVGAADGLTFAFDKVRRSPDTTRSHVLVAAAPEAVRPAIVDAIHAAYFERGEDTGDVAVLARLAAEAGWDAAAARAALEDAEAARRTREQALAASRRGVRGVPHFTISGREGVAPRVLSGAQPVAALKDAVQAVAAP